MRKGRYNTDGAANAVVLDGHSSCTGHGVVLTLHDRRIYYILDGLILLYLVQKCNSKLRDSRRMTGVFVCESSNQSNLNLLNLQHEPSPLTS